jgi:hypothetical protein
LDTAVATDRSAVLEPLIDEGSTVWDLDLVEPPEAEAIMIMRTMIMMTISIPTMFEFSYKWKRKWRLTSGLTNYGVYPAVLAC